MAKKRKRVAILTNRLLDWETREPRYGGGERYCLALGSLFRDEKFEVQLFQAGREGFEGEYHGFPVTALPIGRHVSEFHEGICDQFFEATQSYDHVLINVPAYASGRVREDAIVVCHGIWFDHDNWPPPIRFRTPEWFSHLYRAFAQPGRVVSVDTNSINVIRSFWPELAPAMHFIPNWVDTEAYHPRGRKGEPPTILFPRRVEVNRGSRLMGPILAAVPHDARFLWVGDGEPDEVAALRQATASDRRFELTSAAFDEMPPFYRKASICVIPTIACEGTSLACLEAMASGCAVVATTVGGLPDLVRDGVNGLLVDPDAASIAAAIRRLFDDRDLRERLAKAAVAAAKGFDETIWRARWKAFLGQQGWFGAPARAIAAPSATPHHLGDSLLLAPAAGSNVTAASSRIANLESHLAFAENADVRHKEAIEFLRREIAARESSIAFMKDEIASRDGVIEFFKNEVDLRDRSIEFLKNEVDLRDRSIEFLTAEVATLREFGAKQEERARASEERAIEASEEPQREIDRLRGDLDLLAAQIDIKEREVTFLREKTARQEEGIEWLRGEVANRDAQLRAIHESKLWRTATTYWRGRNIASKVTAPLQITVREAALRTGRKVLPSRVKRFLKRFWDPNQQISPKEAIVIQSVRAQESAERAEATPSLPERYDVVCFSIIDWSFRWQRPQQVMARFAAEGHRVFFISTTEFLPPGETRYALHALRENVWELKLASPRPIDVYGGELAPDVVDYLRGDFDALRKDLGIHVAISFIQVPTWAPAAYAARERFGWKVVYDCMDDWDTFPGMKPALIDQERRLVREADVLVVSAQRLVEKWTGQNDHLVLARNAADFEHYASAGPNDLLADAPHPIVGYFGAIADWFDLPLMIRLASERPQYTFVLIGGIFNVPMDELESLPNVRILGQKPYELMPSYLFHFDACIIPFVVNEVTEATDPVKFYEYISLGKPVVAPRMSELFTYSDYLYIAEDADDFLRNVDAAVHEDDPELCEARVELARRNTWHARLEEIKRAVRDAHPKLSIIVVTYFNLDYTKLCVESIFRNTLYPNFELILVDNGSTDGTPEYLREVERQQPHVRVILNERNLGFARANNQGLEIATGEYLVLLNNDTVVPNGWASKMIRNLDRPDLGLVVTVTNFSGNESRIDVPYRDLGGMQEFAARYTLEHEGAIFDIRVAAMYCAGMRRDVFETVGFLDERFSVGMFEDDDYSHRMRLAGYRVICAEDVFVHHFGQASFKKLSQTEYQAIWDRNQKLYEEKWGVEWTPHTLRAR